MTPHFPPRSSYSAQLPSMLVILICAALTPRVLVAATYHVNPAAQSAADTNPGTESAPWKTISRAASAQELQPGDTVMVHSGVYREHVEVKVSGQPERPITFMAAPGARVVLKGSEMARGRWQKLAEQADRKEPYPNAFTGVWRLVLGDEYFTHARFQGSYQDKTHRWVSQVLINESKPLQRIGLDPIYQSDEYLKLAVVGRGLADMIEDSLCPYQRTVASNHADYNVYANTGWTPTLRHSWNPDNTLAQWQERFQEDLHSTLLPVEFELTGTRFAMKTCQGLNSLAPLPDEVRSVLPAFTHAGCRRIQWPPKAE